MVLKQRDDIRRSSKIFDGLLNTVCIYKRTPSVYIFVLINGNGKIISGPKMSRYMQCFNQQNREKKDEEIE
jgi:hypothetical protein